MHFIKPMSQTFHFRLVIFHHLDSYVYLSFYLFIKMSFYLYIYTVFYAFPSFYHHTGSAIVAVNICLFFRTHFMRQSSPRELLSTKTHFTSVVMPFKLQIRFVYFVLVTTSWNTSWKENEELEREWRRQQQQKENKIKIKKMSKDGA